MKTLSLIVLTFIVLCVSAQTVSTVASLIRPTTALPSTCTPYSVRSSSAGISICKSDGSGWNTAATASGAVTSITGTANQIIASASTGAVTLSLPQSFATTSTPTLGGLSLNVAPDGVNLNFKNAGGTLRWIWRGTGTETGSGDTGYDLELLPRADGGGAISGMGSPITIKRSNGLVSFGSVGAQTAQLNSLSQATSRPAARFQTASGESTSGTNTEFRNSAGSLKAYILDSGLAAFAGDVLLTTAGSAIQIKSGANACIGSSTLVGGTVTTSTTCAPTAGTTGIVQYSRRTSGGTIGNLNYTTVAGTSITFTSDSASDTSVIDWVVIKQN